MSIVGKPIGGGHVLWGHPSNRWYYLHEHIAFPFSWSPRLLWGIGCRIGAPPHAHQAPTCSCRRSFTRQPKCLARFHATRARPANGEDPERIARQADLSCSFFPSGQVQNILLGFTQLVTPKFYEFTIMKKCSRYFYFFYFILSISHFR